MSIFYQIDSTRVSLREYWWWRRSPLVIVRWLQKWLRLPIRCSSDDPNTDSTLPYIVESLHPDIAAGLAPLTAELAGLGFGDPVFHEIYDPCTQTVIGWATFRHGSGRYWARIHRRIWHQTANPNRALFPLFFTSFADGTFLVSSAGKPDMAAPPTVQMNRMPGAGTGRLWESHQRLTEQLAGRKMVAPVNSREDVVAETERLQVQVRDFHLARGVFRARTAAEQGQADAFAARVAQTQAAGLEHGEVLAEWDKLQDKKPGWGATLWVLAGSLVLFIALGAARWNWQLTLWLIPVPVFMRWGIGWRCARFTTAICGCSSSRCLGRRSRGKIGMCRAGKRPWCRSPARCRGSRWGWCWASPGWYCKSAG